MPKKSNKKEKIIIEIEVDRTEIKELDSFDDGRSQLSNDIMSALAEYGLESAVVILFQKKKNYFDNIYNELNVTATNLIQQHKSSKTADKTDRRHISRINGMNLATSEILEKLLEISKRKPETAYYKCDHCGSRQIRTEKTRFEGFKAIKFTICSNCKNTNDISIE